MPYLLQGSETFHEKKEGISYRISKSIIDWLPHADNGCETCDLYTMNKKGKRKKTKKKEED